MRNRLTTVQDGKCGSSALEHCIGGSSMTAYKVARRLCGNPAEAKELVQETAYKVLLNWGRYDSTKAFDKWFFRVMRNVFIDSRRRFETRCMISLDAPVDGNDGIHWGETLHDSKETPLERLEREESVGLVRRGLNRMRQEDREVLMLRDMDGLRYDEIAAALSLPVGTVRSRIHRARGTFRGMWLQLEMVAQ